MPRCDFESPFQKWCSPFLCLSPGLELVRGQNLPKRPPREFGAKAQTDVAWMPRPGRKEVQGPESSSLVA